MCQALWLVKYKMQRPWAGREFGMLETERRPAWVVVGEAGKVGEDEPGEVGSGCAFVASSALWGTEVIFYM